MKVAAQTFLSCQHNPKLYSDPLIPPMGENCHSIDEESEQQPSKKFSDFPKICNLMSSFHQRAKPPAIFLSMFPFSASRWMEPDWLKIIWKPLPTVLVDQ
ncbi:hypothetical protein SLE2022_007030 [Rubroshorea leprosula]